MRIIIILGLIVTIGAAWVGGWFYASQAVEDAIAKVKTRFENRAQSLECNHQEIVGFPFRIGLFCKTFKYSSQNSGLEISTNGIRSATQFYQPGKAIAEFEAPAFIRSPRGNTSEVTWDSMRASMKANLDGLERFSIHGQELVSRDARTGIEISTIQDVQIHSRKNGENNVDLALAFNDFKPLAGPLSKLAEFDLGLKITLSDIYRDLLQEANLLRLGKTNGLAGNLDEFKYEPLDGGKVTISGPWKTNTSGLLSGEFQVTISELNEISRNLILAFPQAAPIISQLTSAASLLSSQSQGSGLSLPVSLNKGRISIGIIPVGKIPPLY